MKRLLLPIIGLLLVCQAPKAETYGNQPQVSPQARARVGQTFARMPLRFEANTGQTGPEVQFLSRGNGHTLFLTPSEAVLTLARPSDQKPSVLRMRWIGSNPNPRLTGLDSFQAKTNYFIGNDPKKWRTDVPNYGKIAYEGVYPGIDLVYYGNQRQLEYDFVVFPGADPGAVTLSFKGARRLSVNQEGALVLQLANGEVIQHKPLVYQGEGADRRELSGSYVLKSGNRVGFRIAAYDKSRTLVIDPTLSYSTYLGGTNDEFSNFHNLGIDGSGNIYMAGTTASTDFPTQNGFQGDPGDTKDDVFVVKLDPSQTGNAQLVYATYLGGSDQDSDGGLAVDATGHVYVGGNTKSNNFPTLNAYQGTLSAANDAFLVKLDPSQSGSASLVYATYLGGDSSDFGYDVSVDSSGVAYLTGQTDSSNFPTRNAFQASPQGGDDGFVAKIDPSQSGDASLLYATYLGGSLTYETATSVAVGGAGKIYVTGTTGASDFPLKNQYESFPAGNNGWNIFVTVLDPAQSGSSQLIYSTYFGGATDSEYSEALAVDSAGMVYVTGFTRATDTPTRNGFQSSLQNALGDEDVFVAKFDPSQSGDASLLYATYLGGSGLNDNGFAIAVDALGKVYVTGTTDSTDFPTRNPLYASKSGTADAFLAKIDPTQSGDASLLFSTYLGGGGYEEGDGVAVDASCNVTVGGSTESTDFPTQNPYQASSNGMFDGFAAKIIFDGPSVTSALTASGTVGSAFSYTITADGATPLTFDASSLPDGLTFSGTGITGTPTTAGTTNVTITATNSDCVQTETLVVTVTSKSGGGCSLIR